MTPPPAAVDLDAIEARAESYMYRNARTDILALVAEVRRLTRERDQAIEAERERCAKVALKGVVEMKARDPRWFDEEIATREKIAAAIRAAR